MVAGDSTVGGGTSVSCGTVGVGEETEVRVGAAVMGVDGASAADVEAVGVAGVRVTAAVTLPGCAPTVGVLFALVDPSPQAESTSASASNGTPKRERAAIA